MTFLNTNSTIVASAVDDDNWNLCKSQICEGEDVDWYLFVSMIEDYNQELKSTSHEAPLMT